MGQHAVRDLHDHQRRKDGQEADRDGGNQQIAEVLALLHHDADQPAQGERRIGFRLRSFGAQQDRFAAPDLGQAHFVDRDRRIGFRRARIADEDDLAFRVGAGQQPGGTVVEQQHDRTGAGDREQMTPAQAQRP